MSKSSVHFVLTVGVFFVVSACRAGTVTATLGMPTNNPSLGSQNVVVNINYGDGNTNFFGYAYPGYINWTRTGGDDAAIGHLFQTFCIEIGQDVYIGSSYTYTIQSLASAPNPGTDKTGGANGMGPAKADAIARLWNGFHTDHMSNVDAAAFQLAIWRIEYDWNPSQTATSLENFSTGNFRTNGGNADAISKAQELLGYVFTGAKGYDVAAANLVALTDPDHQDQVMQTPEPSSLCLGVIGGLALSLAGYRRRVYHASGLLRRAFKISNSQ